MAVDPTQAALQGAESARNTQKPTIGPPKFDALEDLFAQQTKVIPPELLCSEDTVSVTHVEPKYPHGVPVELLSDDQHSVAASVAPKLHPAVKGCIEALVQPYAVVRYAADQSAHAKSMHGHSLRLTQRPARPVATPSTVAAAAAASAPPHLAALPPELLETSGPPSPQGTLTNSQKLQLPADPVKQHQQHQPPPQQLAPAPPQQQQQQQPQQPPPQHTTPHPKPPPPGGAVSPGRRTPPPPGSSALPAPQRRRPPPPAAATAAAGAGAQTPSPGSSVRRPPPPPVADATLDMRPPPPPGAQGRVGACGVRGTTLSSDEQSESSDEDDSGGNDSQSSFESALDADSVDGARGVEGGPGPPGRAPGRGTMRGRGRGRGGTGRRVPPPPGGRAPPGGGQPIPVRRRPPPPATGALPPPPASNSGRPPAPGAVPPSPLDVADTPPPLPDDEDQFAPPDDEQPPPPDQPPPPGMPPPENASVDDNHQEPPPPPTPPPPEDLPPPIDAMPPPPPADSAVPVSVASPPKPRRALPPATLSPRVGNAAAGAAVSPRGKPRPVDGPRRRLSSQPRMQSLTLPASASFDNTPPLESPRCDPLDRTLLERSGDVQRASCADRRHALLARPLLGVRDGGSSSSSSSVKQRTRPLPRPFTQARRRRILVNMGEVKLELGVSEPLFVTVAVHDKRRGQRISEEFGLFGHWDTANAMLNAQSDVSPDPRVRCRQGLFSFDAEYQAARDLVLIVRVTKLLNNEFEKDIAPYLTKKGKSAIAGQLSSELATLARNTQAYKFRQPFCWGVRPVFLPNEAVDERPVRMDLFASRVGALNDAAIYDLLDNLPRLRKERPLPGHIVTEVFDVSSKWLKIKGMLTPSLELAGQAAKEGQIVRQLLEFGVVDSPTLAYQSLLYMYPEAVTPSGVKVKELNVQIRATYERDPDDIESPLKFFPKHDMQLRSSEDVTLVQRKDKRPQLTDELKMCLPAVLSQRSLIRFSFYHVDLSNKQYKLVPFAVAAMPLFRDGRLLPDGDHILTMSTQWTGQDAEVREQSGELRKMQFQLRTRVASTVHSSDDHFNAFFRDSVRNIGAITRIAPETVAQLFTALTARLMLVMCSKEALQQPALGHQAFVALQHVLKTVSQRDETTNDKESSDVQHSTLDVWLHYTFDNPRGVPGQPYEELTRHWLRSRQAGHVRDHQLNEVLFGIIVKSMTLKVAASGELARGGSRRAWFNASFVNELMALVRSMHKPREQFVLRDTLRDLTRVLERGAAMQMIYEYVEWLRLCDADRDFGQRALFWHALGADEQFVALCLPVPIAVDVLDPELIADKLLRQHTPIGLLLKHFDGHLSAGLPTPPATQRIVDILFEWASLVDLNPQFTGTPKARALSADLLLPLVTLLSTHVKQLPRIPGEHRLKLLRCVLFVIKSCSRSILREYYRTQTQLVQEGLLVLLTEALRHVRAAMHAVKNATAATTDARAVQTGATTPREPPAPGLGPRRTLKRGETSQSELKTTVAQALRAAHRQPTQAEMTAWSVASVAVIDVVHWFLVDHLEECNKPSNRLFVRAFALLHMLFLHVTPDVVPQLYATIHFVVHNFRDPLFKHSDNSFCEVLTFLVLSHCNSRSANIRSCGRALYYWLLMANYEETGNFSKVKLQSIIGVSKLLGGGEHKEFVQLQGSLGAIQQHAAAQRSTAQHPIVAFVGELADLVATLIQYQARIANSAHDPELLADLYYNISNGYSDSPDLRVAWLENLGQIQKQHGNFAESAMAKLHQAALVLMYLSHEQSGSAAPLPYETLLAAVPNQDKELGLPPFEATEFASKVWSKDSLVELLQEAIKLLDEAQLYEEAIILFQLVLAIYQQDANYSDMVPALADFKTMTEALVAANSNQARLPPNYYRVGLYGQAFGPELDGKEFIYKVSPSLTLGHFQKKLVGQFGKTIGANNIEVLTTNKDLDIATLDKRKAHIQIGNVKPYLEKAKDASDPVAVAAAAAQNKKVGHIARFVFEAAYSEGRKALSEDDFSKQQKRKVIFTTEFSIPYLKARVPVVDREEIILSASDNAIEMMAERVEKLKSELRYNPPRQNSLQQVIQGSVAPMVNGGPKTICEIFLAQPNKDMTPLKRQQLARIMEDFLVLCERALVLNKSIISASHVKFQEMCEKFYAEMKKDLTIMIEKGRNLKE